MVKTSPTPPPDCAPTFARETSIPLTESPRLRRKLIGFMVLAIIVVACFTRPLWALIQFALHSELYSHILLIPFITGYLIWLQRQTLILDAQPSRKLALLPLLVGLAILTGYWFARSSGWQPRIEDYLSLMTFAVLAFLFAGAIFCLGFTTLRRLIFPAAFLLFMIPFPNALLTGIETFLQHGSAEAAWVLLRLSGMPVFQDGLTFQLPGFSMHVAPECSGIHSSLVLFITSLLGSYLLLSRRWTRSVFVLAVLPLAILRNGFRIFVLGELCVRLNPDWINSDLHRRGGPIFFVLSLIPLFALLWWLRKRESHPAN
jgi:exosortase C (VPDSG-CTERM-specific)